MSQIEDRLRLAKSRMIERRMIPKAFYLTPRDFAKFGRDMFEQLPVRCSKSRVPKSLLYSNYGCSVSVPLKAERR